MQLSCLPFPPLYLPASQIEQPTVLGMPAVGAYVPVLQLVHPLPSPRPTRPAKQSMHSLHPADQA